jgi:hypothetical protein
VSQVTYKKNADRPALELWWFDRTGALINFSSGYTFSLKIGHPGSSAVLTKTTNITGAAGSGTAPDGTPNLTVTWAAGELALTPSSYTAELTATTSSLDRVFTFRLNVLDVVV